MIDYDNDGAINDLRLKITLDNQVNSERQNVTLIFEDIGSQLAMVDLQIMTDAEFDTYQSNQIDTYLSAIL